MHRFYLPQRSAMAATGIRLLYGVPQYASKRAHGLGHHADLGIPKIVLDASPHAVSDVELLNEAG